MTYCKIVISRRVVIRPVSTSMEIRKQSTQNDDLFSKDAIWEIPWNLVARTMSRPV